MIRVLHFTYSLQGGGAERQLKFVVNALNRACYSSAICCVNDAGYEEVHADTEIFRVKKVRRLDLGWYSARKVIQHWQPHIIHNWVPVSLPTSLPASLFIGNNSMFLASYRNVYRLQNAKRLIHALAFALSDEIVSNVRAEELLPPFRQLYDWKPSHFIPNGVDIDRIRSAQAVDLTEFGIDPSAFTILFAGRLVPQKNAEVALQAMRLLTNRNLPLHLLICGEGQCQTSLISMAKTLGVEEHVTFAGYRSDLYGVMKNCDLFVQPSYWEGMPNTLFEAMASGLPVTASDIPVHRRWLGDDGRIAPLFNPTDACALSDHIAHLMTDHHDRTSQMQAATALVESLSIRRMVKAYERLYANLASQTGAING